MDLITNHWTVTHIPKNEKQEQVEQSLCLYLPGIPFSRWILFPSAFIIQFCCGSLYSWSVLNAPIDTYLYNDKNANKTVIAFYLAVACFGFTAALLGPWLERNGPRAGLMLGTTAIAIGHAIVAISLHSKSIVGLYLGYGIFSGFGLGLNYISPVSALQKWFPDHRGLASGFAVGGFGAGSLVWSKLYTPLFTSLGFPAMFAIVGAILCSLLFFCTIALRTPPNDFSSHEFGAKNTVFDTPTDAEKQDKQALEQNASNVDSNEKSQAEYSLTDSIFSPDYIVLYVVFFCNQLFGLVAISRLANMATDLFYQTDTNEITNVVAINGFFNCLGRLLFPMASDLIVRLFSNGGHTFHPSAARKGVFFVTLGLQIVIVGVLPTLINNQSYGGFKAVIWILTACYGAGFGTIPALLTDMWGPYNIGALHGLILTAWSIAGVGGGIGFNSNVLKYTTDHPKQYYSNFVWILPLISVGFLLLFFVRTNPKDRQERGYKYSFAGLKLFHIGA